MYNQVERRVGQVDGIASDLQSGKGSAGKLLKDDALYNNANHSLAHVEFAPRGCRCRQGWPGSRAEGPEVREGLAAIRWRRSNQLVTGINQGKGTLGKLATDDTVNTNLNNLLSRSDRNW